MRNRRNGKGQASGVGHHRRRAHPSPSAPIDFGYTSLELHMTHAGDRRRARAASVLGEPTTATPVGVRLHNANRIDAITQLVTSQVAPRTVTNVMCSSVM